MLNRSGDFLMKELLFFFMLASAIVFSTMAFAGPFSEMQAGAAKNGVCRIISLSAAQEAEADKLLLSAKAQMDALLGVMTRNAGMLSPETMRHEAMNVMRAFVLDAKKGAVRRGLLPKGHSPEGLRPAVDALCAVLGANGWETELEDALACLVGENARPEEPKKKGWLF